MSDDLVDDALVSVRAGQLSLDAFRAVLDAFNPYEKVEEAGFVAWRPIDPFLGGCSDRRSLQQFARFVLAHKYIDVRELAKSGDLSSRLVLLFLRQLMRTTKPDAVGFQTNIPHYGLLGVIRAIQDSDWDALLSGQTLSAGQLGAINDMLKLFDEFGISVDSKSLTDRYRHPAELYPNDELGETPVRIVSNVEPVYRMTDTFDRRWTRWDVQSLGVVQLSLRSRMIDGVPHVDKSREQFESDCDRRFRFQIGTRSQARFEIDLPAGNVMTCPLPRPIEDVSMEISYSELPQALRDRTWEMVCRAATERAMKGSG